LYSWRSIANQFVKVVCHAERSEAYRSPRC
jgi:hypothetical protein